MSDPFGVGIIREVVELDVVDSTNRYALSSGRTGMLVTANEQTSGRGRMGRSWHSPKEGNLYMTFTVQEADPRLPILAGVAVREALAGFIGDKAPVEVKWPNDILADGRKICGILCETRKITAVGIGININQTQWPPDLEARATSLATILGKTLNKDDILRSVILSLGKWFSLFTSAGFGPVRQGFLRHGLLEGHDMATEDGLSCRILDLTMEGHLIIDASGTRRELVSGTILLRS